MNRILLASCGLALAGMACGRAAGSGPMPEFVELRNQIASRPTWNLPRLARETLRPEALILESDRSPVDVVLRRTRALWNHLRQKPGGPTLDTEGAALAILAREVAAWQSGPLDPAREYELFHRLVDLRRQIAFQNPLLDFDSILFLKHNKQARGEVHMVDQYLGFNAGKTGGVFVLEKAFSTRPRVRNLLEKSRVENGRLRGRTLHDQGAFIALDLDYDGRSIVFAFSEAEWRQPPGVTCDTNYWKAMDIGPKGRPQHPAHYLFRPESCYHVFRAGVDGSGLTQLTDGPWNDFDPCFLPNGRLAFISSRAGGQCRCGARPLPTFTLHAMMRDGSDVVQLSWHDTNEWQPSVDEDGMLVYTRWDYVDRDSDVAHHFWRCYPDGRNPRSPHGNYPDARESRPWMELSIRAIPGSKKYLAVAAPHHGEAYGSLVQIDLSQPDDRATGQLRRFTPEVLFPESESAPGHAHTQKGRHSPKGEVYGTPWPLDEDFCLCVYDPQQSHYGIYLVDSFGNRELLYADPATACLDPIPFKPRPRPPVIPVQTIQARADRPAGADLSSGTVVVLNAYESVHPWPANTRLKELRVVNIFPKDNALQNAPDMGVAAQSLGRGVLGTAPVEADGSAHFRMPSGMPVYFQLLDENGLMVQTMRSATYLHPGEKLTCGGCHENQHTATRGVSAKVPLALRRPPSNLRPEATGSYPLTFPRLVQPVLNTRCIPCHEQQPRAPGLRGDRFAANGRSQAFESLRKYAWGMSGGNGVAWTERQYSIPGQSGARVSQLYGLLAAGHHDLRLAPEELRRITLWLDCNSNFYGAYHDPEAQAQGQIVKPVWGLPPWTDFSALVR